MHGPRRPFAFGRPPRVRGLVRFVEKIASELSDLLGFDVSADLESAMAYKTFDAIAFRPRRAT